MKKNIIITAIFFIAFSLCTHAQTNSLHLQTKNTNAWFMYFGDHKFSNKWGVHLEAQLRRNEIINHPQQILLRTGLNYHPNNQMMFTTGYCFVQTSPYGAFAVKATYPEHRLWEQFQIKNQYGKVEYISRYRLEQRFSKLPVLNTSNVQYEAGDAIYTNRFRTLHRVSVPFRGQSILDKSFYLSAYDEIFINFGKKVAANLFDQNRTYVALGYKIKHLGKAEVGYMYQAILKSDGIKIENNHTLMLSISSTINFYSPKKK
jgi:hypothetical protein